MKKNVSDVKAKELDITIETNSYINSIRSNFINIRTLKKEQAKINQEINFIKSAPERLVIAKECGYDLTENFYCAINENSLAKEIVVLPSSISELRERLHDVFVCFVALNEDEQELGKDYIRQHLEALDKE